MANGRTRLQNNKIFLLSGLEEDERKRLSVWINDLDGLYLNSDSYRQNCTHVICGKLSRSEKFLGACSMGKWILHPDYIRRSAENGNWLQEELFEWSNYNAPGIPQDLRTAGSRWRFNYEVFQTFPFSDWNVAVVVTGAKRCSVYRRLLACGGAKVFNLKFPVKDIAKVAQTLTYIFVNEKSADSVLHLVEYGILCLRPEFIGDYLVKDPTPDPMDYLVQTATKESPEDLSTMDINFSQHAETPESSQLDCSQTGDEFSFFPGSQNSDFEITTRATRRQTLSSLSNSSSNSSPNLGLLKKVTRRSLNIKSETSSPVNKKEIKVMAGNAGKSSSVNTSRSNTPDISNKNKTIESGRSSRSTTPNSEPKRRLTRQSSSQPSNSPLSQSPIKVLKQALENHMELNLGRCTRQSLETRSTRSTTPDSDILGHMVRHGLDSSPEKSNSSINDFLKPTSGHNVRESDGVSSRCSSPDLMLPRRVTRQNSGKSSAPSTRSNTPDIEPVGRVTRQKSQISSAQSSISTTPDSNVNAGKMITRQCQSPANSEGTSHENLVQNSSFDSGPSIKNNQEKAIKSETQTACEDKEPISGSSLNRNSGVTTMRTRSGNSFTENCKNTVYNEDKTGNGLQAKSENVGTNSLTPKSDSFQNIHHSEKIDAETSSDKENSCKSNEKKPTKNDTKPESKILTNQTRRISKRLNNKVASASEAVPVVDKEHVETEVICSLPSASINSKVNADVIDVSSTPNAPTKRKIETDEPVPKRLKVYDDKFHWLPAIKTFNSFLTIKEEETVVKTEEMSAQFSTSLSNIVLTCLDETTGQQFLSAGIDIFKSSITTKKYPDPSLLHILMSRILMGEGISEFIANRTYCALMKVLQFHPPTTLVAINMYNQSLVYSSDNEYRENQDWLFIKDAISDVIQANNRKNGTFLLKFLLAVLEQNYTFVIQRFKEERYSVQKLKSSMLGQLLWSSHNQIFFNSRCRDILGFIEEVLSMDLLQEEKSDMLQILLSLFGMAANLCYLIESNSQPVNCSIFGKNVASFLHEITKVINYRLDDQMLKEVLMMLQPSWFCLGVCCYLLADYDDYMLPEGLPKDKISLRDIVDKYFCLLPKLTTQSKDLIKSPHKKRMTVTSRPSTPHSFTQRSSPASTPKKIAPLSPASKNTPEKSVMRLMKNINKRNFKGETPLHTACIRNDVIKLNQLLKVPGVDVNVVDNAGWTPMHEACNHGNLQCVKALLQFVPAKTVDHYFSKGGARCKKVDLLLGNSEGITPLHDAVLNNRQDICLLLLQHAGSILLKSKTVYGYTPLDLVSNDDIRDLLLSYADDPSAISSSQEFTGSQESSQGHGVPGNHLYEQVLGEGHQEKRASVEECVKYISVISFLITSYLSATDVTNQSTLPEQTDKENCSNQFNSHRNNVLKSDLKILQNFSKYVHRFENHVKKICDSPEAERLDLELGLLMCLQINC